MQLADFAILRHHWVGVANVFPDDAATYQSRSRVHPGSMGLVSLYSWQSPETCKASGGGRKITFPGVPTDFVVDGCRGGSPVPGFSCDSPTGPVEVGESPVGTLPRHPGTCHGSMSPEFGYSHRFQLEPLSKSGAEPHVGRCKFLAKD
jgi:hypothetical protein